MNIVRALTGRGSGTVPRPQDQTLYLTHLRRLFEDVRHPKSSISPEELEVKIYNMLPLFCKVS